MEIDWVIDQPNNQWHQGGGSFGIAHSALHAKALACLGVLNGLMGNKFPSLLFILMMLTLLSCYMFLPLDILISTGISRRYESGICCLSTVM